MPLYPGTGATGERGEYNNIVNAPLEAGDGGMQFREAMEVAILPRLEAFAPDLLIISAGFDAHRRDPLANLNLVEADFAWATCKLMDVADRMLQRPPGVAARRRLRPRRPGALGRRPCADLMGRLNSYKPTHSARDAFVAPSTISTISGGRNRRTGNRLSQSARNDQVPFVALKMAIDEIGAEAEVADDRAEQRQIDLAAMRMAAERSAPRVSARMKRSSAHAPSG